MTAKFTVTWLPTYQIERARGGYTSSPLVRTVTKEIAVVEGRVHRVDPG